MELDAWNLSNIKTCGTLFFKYANQQLRVNLLTYRHLHAKLEYRGNSESLFTSLSSTPYNACYFLWWENIGYKIIVSRQNFHLSDYLYDVILGSYNWFHLFNNQFPGLLDECLNCSCYNDYLVTGQCNGKIDGVEITRTTE